MRKRAEPPQHGNLIAMIDVVFQLVIFFVCTTKMQEGAMNDRVNLAMAPDGKAVEQKDPSEIQIAVSADGKITIANTLLSESLLVSVLHKSVADAGRQVPVIIRGDKDAEHKDIKRVMDACARAGIWKISFAAIKEKG